MTTKPIKPVYKRRHYWIDAPLQIQMVGYVLILISASLCLTALSVWRGIQAASFESHQIFHSLEWINANLRAPLILASAISLLAAGLLTLFWSHRFAGPLRVISSGITRVRHGNLTIPVRVRTTDAHQDLAEEFQKMQEELRRMVETDRSHVNAAIANLENDPVDVDKALAELKQACTHYHL